MVGQRRAIDEFSLGGVEFEAPVLQQEEMWHSWLETGNTEIEVSICKPLPAWPLKARVAVLQERH